MHYRCKIANRHKFTKWEIGNQYLPNRNFNFKKVWLIESASHPIYYFRGYFDRTSTTHRTREVETDPAPKVSLEYFLGKKIKLFRQKQQKVLSFLRSEKWHNVRRIHLSNYMMSPACTLYRAIIIYKMKLCHVNEPSNARH